MSMLQGTYLIQMECVYHNGKAAQGAVEMLRAFHERHIPYVLVSEQSASDRERITERLRQAGLPYVRAANIYTGANAAAAYIAWRWPDKRKIYSVGGRGIRMAMKENDLIEDRKHPDFVLMGMDRDLTYADYNDILHVLNGGARLVSVDNRIVQYTDGEADLGNGSIAQMLAGAAGTKVLSFGRGTSRLIEACARYMGVNTGDLLAAGNDFRRDLIPAIACECTTFLVSEGRDILKSGITDSLHPDYIVDDVSGIAK